MALTRSDVERGTGRRELCIGGDVCECVKTREEDTGLSIRRGWFSKAADAGQGTTGAGRQASKKQASKSVDRLESGEWRWKRGQEKRTQGYLYIKLKFCALFRYINRNKGGGCSGAHVFH